MVVKLSGGLAGLAVAAGLVLAGVAMGPDALAQEPSETVRKMVDEARRANPSLRVRIDPVTGLPTSIRGLRPVVDPDITLGASRSASGRPSETDIRKAAEAYFRTGELSAAFTTRAGRTDVSASRVRRDPDFPGQSVVHVEQRVDGVPVFGSSGRVVVSPSLAVTNLSATFSNVDIATTTPKVAPDAATATARAHVKGQLETRRDGGAFNRLRERIDTVAADATLVIFDPALMRNRAAKAGPTRLAWLVQIDDFRVFVDADTGAVLFDYVDRRSMTPRRVFDLEGKHEFPGLLKVEAGASVAVEGLPADVRAAYSNAGSVLTYFARLYDRTGIFEDEGEVVTAYVGHGGTKFAHWCSGVTFGCPEPGVMVYGPSAAGALDIVGHEMMHGIITAEADLVYVDESGAVNEGLADIFGALIEMDADPAEGNWVLGERLPGFSMTAAIRNMADPPMADADGAAMFDRTKAYGAGNRGQPDHYADYVTREDPICETTTDYYSGCVHFNSGILNKFAYLVAEGGRHRGVVALGIGRDKLGRAAYRSLTVHLNPSSTLKDTAEAFETSCRELAAGAVGGFASADCNRIRDAAIAVGLISVGS
ncbi:MAG: M4 family metallopeptidase [Hyphomicrobiaceae bacterium]|nr:M4 family metallopeptidase [Hyphomicrobiaceae bacterium]